MYDSQSKIESGKQLGISSSILRGKDVYWATVAIQKYNHEYVVHIDLILEKNMEKEEYEKYETYAFSSLEAATKFLIENNPLLITNLSELKPFKGQKGFSVEAEEIIRII
jgi:hypothetical protein